MTAGLCPVSDSGTTPRTVQISLQSCGHNEEGCGERRRKDGGTSEGNS